MALYQSLAIKSENGERVDFLSEEEKVVLFVEMLEAEINNGGFDQYFFNKNRFKINK